MRISRCLSCGAPGVWMKTTNGENILVEEGSIDEAALDHTERGNPLFDTKIGHVAHFANCQHADEWRKGR